MWLEWVGGVGVEGLELACAEHYLRGGAEDGRGVSEGGRRRRGR